MKRKSVICENMLDKYVKFLAFTRSNNSSNHEQLKKFINPWQNHSIVIKNRDKIR